MAAESRPVAVATRSTTRTGTRFALRNRSVSAWILVITGTALAVGASLFVPREGQTVFIGVGTILWLTGIGLQLSMGSSLLHGLRGRQS